ncbi:MAG: cupin domain-containing protein [Phycisphaerae bacterium]|nr:cupin domain-containing protein [Phycisphaerae bacterium]
MKVQSIESHEQAQVTLEGARDTKMRTLIGPDDGATNFHMRHFEIAPGGCTPHHSHNYEHEIVVLSGQGVAMSEEGERPFKTGDVIFVPANERHQLVNRSGRRLEVICLVPALEP